MISIQYLKYFMKITETRSLSQAAELLFISQPALSQAMKNLEAELGVVLLKRSNRGIEITREGEILFRHCEILMRQLSVIENLSEYEQKPRLSVSAFPYVVYPKAFTELRKKPAFADLQLQYDECRVNQILENVDKMICELGLIQYNNRQESVVHKKLRKMNLEWHLVAERPWAVAVGPGSPLYDCRQLLLEQLLPFRQIRLRDDYFSVLTGEIQVQDILMDNLKYDFVDSGAMARYLLKNTDSFMFCCTQKYFMDEEDAIRVIPLTDTGVQIAIGWVKRKNHQLSEEAGEFLKLWKKDFE